MDAYPQYASIIQAGLDKLDDYVDLADMVPAYRVALCKLYSNSITPLLLNFCRYQSSDKVSIRC